MSAPIQPGSNLPVNDMKDIQDEIKKFQDDIAAGKPVDLKNLASLEYRLQRLSNNANIPPQMKEHIQKLMQDMARPMEEIKPSEKFEQIAQDVAAIGKDLDKISH